MGFISHHHTPWLGLESIPPRPSSGPCQPLDLSVTGSCESDTVLLAWTEAGGAVAYIVTASGDLGYVTSFRTNETALEVELLCGQSYAFTVLAQGDVCDGAPSVAAFFTTGTLRVSAWCLTPRAGKSRGKQIHAFNEMTMSMVLNVSSTDGKNTR